MISIGFSGRGIRATATAGLVGAVCVACAVPPPATTAPSPAGSTPPIPAASLPAVSRTPVPVAGTGWTVHGLDGPPFPTLRCHASTATFHGKVQPLPDPRCTPGAVDATITETNIATTICGHRSTRSVRPPYRLTEPAKYQAMAAYGDMGSARPYEFDHLVPLELGGASSTENLWPERNVGGHGRGYYIHNAKDQVEYDLHTAVCDGQVPLAAAQRAIAANWTTAESVLHVAYGSGR